jgi:4-hydroxybutyrate CoA-transferase
MSAEPILSTDWRKLYQERLTTAKDALTRIQSGMVMGSGHFACEPLDLIAALCERKNELQNVKIYHLSAQTPNTFAYVSDASFDGHINHISLFAGVQSRKAVQSGLCDFLPTFFNQVPRLFRERYIPLDACILQLSRPDEDGWCSYGVSCDYAQAMIESSPLVIAELNTQVPYVYGERVHISQLDVIVEVDHPILELKQADPDADTSVAERIAEHVSKIVPDGANLQLGVGALPDMILKRLHDRKDLGIHSETISDGILDLIECGALTCKHNNLNPGKIIANFIYGSRRLYDFVDRNPMILLKPVDYTNNILVAGRVDNLTSINAALQVNLFGEVAADTIGYKQFSGVGGQVDFVRATSMSKGGISVIAMPSTARGGTISRIVMSLTPGTCVTTSRFYVHYIATEYGCVCLRGRTVRERAELLISIAHPDFRESLRKEAIEREVLRA